MSLARRRAQDRVSLRPRVTELGEVFDRVETGLPIGNVNVEVMLLASLVDRDALEDQVVVVGRRDRARLEDRILDAVFGDAILDQADLEVEPTRHLDGPTECDLTVALAEVQV